MMTRISLTDDLDLSRIVYGLWRLTDDHDHSVTHAQAKIEACLEQGITTLDQADIYGAYGCEAALGEVLRDAPHLRDQVEIITKCGIVAPMGRYADVRVKYYDTSEAHIRQSVETSLRLMRIDRIDLLLIHRPDPFMDHMETGRILDALIKSGDVGAVGVSNFRPHDVDLLASAMQQPLVTNQIELSLSALDPFTDGDLAYLQQRGIPPMAWSPLGGGGLFDGSKSALLSRMGELAENHNVDVAAIAVAWLLAHPAQIIPVMGTNRLSRIATLGRAMDVPVNRETWFELYTLSRGVEVA